MIGASRIGISLAVLLQRIGWQPRCLWNRSDAGLQRARKHIQFDISTHHWEELDGSVDWVVIAVRDDAIAELATRLAYKADLRRGTNVFHSSGFYDAGLLKPLARKGARTGSLHPIISVTDIPNGIRELSKTVYSCEGQIADELVQLVEAFGATAILVNGDQKRVIHLSAVLMNNFLTSLMEVIRQLHRECGFTAAEAGRLIGPISRQSTQTGWEHNFTDALTGPIARGDQKTISEQLAFLAQYPRLQEIYRDFLELTKGLLQGKSIADIE